MLWKQKGRRDDLDNLDNYRGICLLSIISRIVARIVSVRLRDWAERQGLFVAEQWGFRPHRSARDAILLFRIVCEEAARSGHEPDTNALFFLLVDINKNLPKCAAAAALGDVGPTRHPAGYGQSLAGLA